jgi:hypothetical protein
LALARSEFTNVIGEEMVQERFGLRAAYRNLPHVGNVENPCVAPHRQVLIDNASVLHGHFPAPEFNQAPAQFLVGLIQGRAL